MPTFRFTDRKIHSLSTRLKREEFTDETLPDLMLRVSRAGSKIWMVRYIAHGRRRRLRLGTYPAIPLVEARQKALEILARVEHGEDPYLEVEDRKRAPTFGELAHEYVERHAKPKKRTWEQDVERLERDILPAWGPRKAQELTRRDVILLLDRIVDRGAPFQANRVKALVSRIFNFGISRGILETNPARLVESPAAEIHRDRVLSLDELRSFWAVLEADGSPMALSFELRILTAQRSGEVLRMRWENLNDDEWTIPGNVTKNGDLHSVFLAPQTREILGRVRSLTPVASPWVFPSPTVPGKPMRSFQKAFGRYLRDSGVAHFRVHDLRRTAASMMTQMGIPRLVVSKVLNHRSADRGVTWIYDRHSYAAEKRDALCRWADRVEEIVQTDSAEFPGATATK